MNDKSEKQKYRSKYNLSFLQEEKPKIPVMISRYFCSVLTKWRKRILIEAMSTLIHPTTLERQGRAVDRDPFAGVPSRDIMAAQKLDTSGAWVFSGSLNPKHAQFFLARTGPEGLDLSPPKDGRRVVVGPQTSIGVVIAADGIDRRFDILDRRTTYSHRLPGSKNSLILGPTTNGIVCTTLRQEPDYMHYAWMGEYADVQAMLEAAANHLGLGPDAKAMVDALMYRVDTVEGQHQALLFGRALGRAGLRE